MKLARMINTQSKFQVPYKLYKDEQEIAEGFQLISEGVYEACFQYVIFDDGVFDYCQDQKFGIIATIENIPFIFITDGPFIVEQIPFETKVDLNNGHVFVRGVFAVEKGRLEQYDEMKKAFEKRVREDLIQQIDKQIADLNVSKKLIQ